MRWLLTPSFWFPSAINGTRAETAPVACHNPSVITRAARKCYNSMSRRNLAVSVPKPPQSLRESKAPKLVPRPTLERTPGAPSPISPGNTCTVVSAATPSLLEPSPIEHWTFAPSPSTGADESFDEQYVWSMPVPQAGKSLLEVILLRVSLADWRTDSIFTPYHVQQHTVGLYTDSFLSFLSSSHTSSCTSNPGRLKEK